MPFWHHGSTLGSYFGTLGPPGGPCGQQVGHEAVWNRIRIDVGLVLGPFFESCFGTEACNFNLCSVCFQGTFCIGFRVGILTLGGAKTNKCHFQAHGLETWGLLVSKCNCIDIQILDQFDDLIQKK